MPPTSRNNWRRSILQDGRSRLYLGKSQNSGKEPGALEDTGGRFPPPPPPPPPGVKWNDDDDDDDDYDDDNNAYERFNCIYKRNRSRVNIWCNIP